MTDERVLHREIFFWRDLLARVAADLEREASREGESSRGRWLASRATRIRKRLHEGVPDEFVVSSNRPAGTRPSS